MLMLNFDKDHVLSCLDRTEHACKVRGHRRYLAVFIGDRIYNKRLYEIDILYRLHIHSWYFPLRRTEYNGFNPVFQVDI